MPTSKRDIMKRKHTAITNALEKAIVWALELKGIYQQHHPDYAVGYDTIAQMIEQARGATEKMKSFI